VTKILYHWFLLLDQFRFLRNTFYYISAVRGRSECDFSILGRILHAKREQQWLTNCYKCIQVSEAQSLHIEWPNPVARRMIRAVPCIVQLTERQCELSPSRKTSTNAVAELLGQRARCDPMFVSDQKRICYILAYLIGFMSFDNIWKQMCGGLTQNHQTRHIMEKHMSRVCWWPWDLLDDCCQHLYCCHHLLTLSHSQDPAAHKISNSRPCPRTTQQCPVPSGAGRIKRRRQQQSKAKCLTHRTSSQIAWMSCSTMSDLRRSDSSKDQVGPSKNEFRSIFCFVFEVWFRVQMTWFLAFFEPQHVSSDLPESCFVSIT